MHDMRTRVCLALFASLAALSSGCATSGPGLDHQRDAADIVTLSLGFGLGVKARAGPVQFGLLYDGTEFVGLRGGTTYCLARRKPPGTSLETVTMLLNFEEFLPDAETTRLTFDRRKAFCSVGVLVFTITEPRGDLHWHETAPYYYTQLEAVVAIGPSVRVGINPGELVDFILGWFGADIYNDDLERRKAQDSVGSLAAPPPAA